MMALTVSIKTTEITAVDAQILSAAFLSAVNAYYADPHNVLKFEKWQKQRQKRMKNGGNNHGK